MLRMDAFVDFFGLLEILDGFALVAEFAIREAQIVQDTGNVIGRLQFLGGIEHFFEKRYRVESLASLNICQTEVVE